VFKGPSLLEPLAMCVCVGVCVCVCEQVKGEMTSSVANEIHSPLELMTHDSTVQFRIQYSCIRIDYNPNRFGPLTRLIKPRQD
jgi:hypothetical protein